MPHVPLHADTIHQRERSGRDTPLLGRFQELGLGVTMIAAIIRFVQLLQEDLPLVHRLLQVRFLHRAKASDKIRNPSKLNEQAVIYERQAVQNLGNIGLVLVYQGPFRTPFRSLAKGIVPFSPEAPEP